MKRLFFATALLAGLLAPAVWAQAGSDTLRMSLDRCLERAIQHAPALEAARQRTLAAEASAEGARASRLPSLSLGGSAGYVTETMDISIPMGPAGTRDLSLGTNESYDMNLSLRAPLYAGGTLTGMEAARREMVDAQRLSSLSDTLALRHDVRSAFFEAVAAQSRFEATEQSVRRLARHVEDVREARRAGTADEESLVAAEARLLASRRGLAMVRAELRTTRLGLGRLMGEAGTLVIPDGSLEEPLADQVQDSDLADRPDVRALDARIRAGEHTVDARSGALLPQVSAQASYHYGMPGVDPAAAEWMHYGSAGVNLSWTLFDWGRRSQQKQEAVAEMRSLRQLRQDVLRTLEDRLAQVRARLDAAEEASELAVRRRDLEQRRHTLVRQRYEQGMASETELLDAEDDLTAAETDLVEARAALRLAEANLLYVLGR